MPFKPGHTKTGGRTKGTPNKATLALKDEIESHLGKSLPSAILERIAQLDDKDAVGPLLDLMSYIFPKRKAVEHSGSVSQEVLDAIDELKDKPTEELLAIVKADE